MPETPRSINDCRILIIEDNRVNQEWLLETLRSAGFAHIHRADNGKRGLEETLSLKPDLVILDLMMPEMDGFEFCRRIRELPEFQHMPIIVQTAMEEHQDKIRAFLVGASDFIYKPITSSELLARMRVHLTNRLLRETIVLQQQKTDAELHAAQHMQRKLLPTGAQVEIAEVAYKLDIAHYFETSSVMGGDCWGMRPVSETRLAIYMLDFSGHGMTAALNVFRIHSLMQELKAHAGEPGPFLTLLNQKIHPLLERSAFATMLYGVIDWEASSFEYAAAAATPSLMLRAEGSPEWLDNRGVPLGSVADIAYTTHYTPFMPGDTIVLASDAYMETPCRDTPFINEEDIVRLLRHAAPTDTGKRAGNMLQAMLNHLQSQRTGDIADDLTITIYRRV